MSYIYNVDSGLTKIKTNTKKYILSAFAAVVLATGVSNAAFAASTDYCGSSANGQLTGLANSAICGNRP